MRLPRARQALEIHRVMVRIRHFEEAAGALMESGRIPGGLHLYVGQEAIAAGVMSHLTPTDQITSTHRGHGHLIAKGGEMARMFAELFGKSTGYCRGKGGSMHISDFDQGMLGANGIVGAGIPIAVGAAFANRYRGNSNVSVTFFGDGATTEGTFHESMGLAALYKLPVVFVCEDNMYAEFTRRSRHQLIVPASDKGKAYGMPGVDVDGMDVIAVHRQAERCIARARAGEGPSYMECHAYRYFDHVGVTGMGVPYRTDEEREEWVARDPILRLEEQMIAGALSSAEELRAVHDEAAQEVADAIEFAERSPEPEAAALFEDVYA
jgi:pyruvate dehydrogenase E1 component alpha subunit